MTKDKSEFFRELSLLMKKYGVVRMPITWLSFDDMHVWSIAYNHGLTVTPTNHNHQYTLKPVDEHA